MGLGHGDGSQQETQDMLDICHVAMPPGKNTITCTELALANDTLAATNAESFVTMVREKCLGAMPWWHMCNAMVAHCSAMVADA